MISRITNWFNELIDSTIIQAVHEGLVLLVPVLTIGSLSLVLINFPIVPYQLFIDNFGGGIINTLLLAIYNGTFGILSIFMTLTISISYAGRTLKRTRFVFGATMSALICFIILCGIYEDLPVLDALGVKSTFSAIFAAILATKIYVTLVENHHLRFNLYADASNEEFNDSITLILPALITAVIFACGNQFIVEVFHVICFQDWFHTLALTIFGHLGPSLYSMLLFTFSSSLLWFFGIHGSDVLDGVSQSIFTLSSTIGTQAPIFNNLPKEIFTKTFLDTFVLIGGCGTTLCLLLAVLFYGKQKSMKTLSKIAIAPMIFNINEIMIFNLPVILNPIFFVPFLIVPLVCVITSTLAVSLGLVPIPITSVDWTTPVLLGGYIATGSIRGMLLQLFNLILGMYIYLPFLKMFEKSRNNTMLKNVNELISLLQKSESDVSTLSVLGLQNGIGRVARMLVADLKHALECEELQLYYQPQYDSDNYCTGAEALLRWSHPICGLVYPPLIIHLAQEGGFLHELEHQIFKIAAKDITNMHIDPTLAFKVSVNVSTNTLQEKDFRSFIEDLVKMYKIPQGLLAIEVTEQMAFNLTPLLHENMLYIKNSGIPLIIDDFSMGHTSLRYLQSDLFTMVKLDGAFVNELDINPRSEEIISSIIGLSHSLNFVVLAECVETAKQKDRLVQIGCYQFQGYLYSPALPYDKFMEHIASALIRKKDFKIINFEVPKTLSFQTIK